MKTFKQFLYFDTPVLSEEIHQELQDILNRSNSSEDPQKLIDFTKKTRALIKSGEDTGLENDKPKKGSSRAVFFPTDNKVINLDGKPTNIKRVVKIAFPGSLDRYKKNGEELLGQMQNRIEADHYTRNNYGMLSENDDGSYSTNHENGVLAPVLGHHQDYHHLEMGHIKPMKKGDFQRLTKCDSHPNGLKFDDMFHALNREYAEAHGQSYWRGGVSDEEHDKRLSHPFVRSLHEMMLTTDMHPGDLRPANMGIWTHPHTGQQYPVVSDYGFGGEVPRAYSDRRKRQIISQNK